MPLRFYGWFCNAQVVPNNALRILLLFRYRIETNSHLQERKIIGFRRNELCESLGLSYNSCQSGLRTLIRLRLIALDPHKTGNKQVIRLTEPTEYNWELIQEKLGFHFIVAEQDRLKKQ